MVEWHMKSERKNSGGRRRTGRRSTKKLVWKGGTFSETKLSEKEQRVVLNKRGKTLKNQLRYALYANIFDPATKKTSKAKILTIIENDANRQFARRNVITKGAIIEVDSNGKKHAKVSSRPGQNGIISAVIVETVETKKEKRKATKKSKTKKTPFSEKGVTKTSEEKEEKPEEKKQAKEEIKEEEKKEEKQKEKDAEKTGENPKEEQGKKSEKEEEKLTKKEENVKQESKAKSEEK